MKKLTACLLTLFLYTFCFGESNEPSSKGDISLSYGLSIPIGKYGSISSTQKSGFAGLGDVWSIDFSRYKNGYIGWAVRIGIGNNAFYTQKLQDQMLKEGISQSSLTNFSRVDVMHATMMAGKIFAITDKYFTQEFKILAGFCFGKTPDLDFSDDNALPTHLQKFNNYQNVCGGGLGASLGSTTKVHINPHLVAKVSVNVTGGSVNYDIPYQIKLQEGSAQMEKYSYKQRVGYIEAYFGLGYNFR